MHYFVICWLSIFFPYPLSGGNSCPPGCHCPGAEVRCISATAVTLNRIPQDIPQTTTRLWLRYQNITHIRRGDFRNLRGIRTLEVVISRVQTIEDYAFEHLTVLAYLSLTVNEISRLNRFSFTGLDMVNYLYLNNNEDLIIEPCSLSGIHSMRTLRLNNNDVTYDPRLWEDCNGSQSTPPIADISDLYISGTGGQIDFNFVLRHPELSRLGIAYPQPDLLREYNVSSLESLSSLTLLGLTFFPREFLIHDNLEVIRIEYSSFIQLPADAFANTSTVNLCIIVNNDLVYIHRDALRGMTRLRTLSLRNNKLRTLPGGLFTDNRLHVVLDLYGNPWNCSCLYWLSSARNVSIRDGTGIPTCNTPASLAGVPLTEVDVTSIAACGTIVTLTESPPLHQLTSSTPGPSSPTREQEPDKLPLGNWLYFALGLSFALVILLTMSHMVRSRRGHREPASITAKDESDVQPGGADGFSHNNQPSRCEGESVYYSAINDSKDNERREDGLDTEDATHEDGMAVVRHITHEYASNSPHDAPQYDRQIHSQDARNIEQDDAYVTIIE